LKEISLGTYNNRQKQKNYQSLKKYEESNTGKKKKFVFLFSFAVVFMLGTIYFLYASFLKDFLYGNECINGECSRGGGLFGSLISEPDLRKTDNLTNALLVGIDTRDDQPGLLNTDTIIVITYDHSKGNVFMTSLPRDLYVKIPTTRPYSSRINSVYSQGVFDADHDKGMEYLIQVVEEITGLDIHYHAMLNFEGFLKIIDEVGGVNVCVENEFSGQYPKGLGWQTVYFKEGCQEMDGDSALKYARTRYSTNPIEASDFARAKRQQKVIIATKDKLMKIENFLNPLRLSEFVQIVGGNIQLSSYNQEDIRAGIKVLQSFDNSDIVNLVLDPNIAGGSLIRTIPGDAYLLGPSSGNWKQVHDFVLAVIETPELLQEDRKIYVYNGGGKVGGAGEVVDKIKENPLLNAWIAGNTTARNHEGIKIYDFSGGNSNATINALKPILENAELINEIPEEVENWYNEDIVIIVGQEVVEELFVD